MASSTKSIQATDHKTLGRNVIPAKYELVYEPNLSTLQFRASEVIEADVAGPTKSIVLHSKDLTINNAGVTTSSGSQIANVSIDPKEETITLEFEKEVSGQVAIFIGFSGVHNNGMKGFYRSVYENNGKNETMVTTQFESTSARRAFPCIDEPEFKAVFEVTLIIDKDKQAISNTTASSTSAPHSDGKVVVSFNRTPKMSTYLLYMGVGNFEHLSADARQGLRVNIISTPGKMQYKDLPMDFARKLIPFLENYFEISLPLKKMDFIAIPDFSAGAMENWGAITFREAELLCDSNSSVQTKKRIAEVIAHELAHQWFGDLVTMKWWDDLWLNESFATFLAFKAIGKTFLEWNTDAEYKNIMSGAFGPDALKSTHPINAKVNTPAEIDGIFDAISYNKGGSILYMLEDFVGEETFRKGLHEYLERNKYGNATKEDLWNAIQGQAVKEGKNLPIARLMSDWVNKPGYPVIEISKTKKGFRLKQSKFTLSGDEKDKWLIGARFSTKKGDGRLLMDSEEMEIRSSSSWIKMNKEQRGFYRVKYSNGILKELGAQIKFGKMSGADAWGIINDLFIFTRSGRAPLGQYLDFVNAYCTDTKYPANGSVIGSLGWLYEMTKGTASNEKVKEAILAFDLPLLDRLGWEPKSDEAPEDTQLRGSVIGQLAGVGHAATISKALQLFTDSVSGKEINPNMVGVVYSIAASNGDAGTFDTLLEIYRKSDRPERKLRALAALAQFRDPELEKRALEFSKTEEVRPQNSITIPAVMAGHDPKTVWTWLKENWNGRYNHRNMLIALGTSKDRAQIEDMKKFFSDPKNVPTNVKRAIEQMLEFAEANALFVSKLSQKELLRD